ncbi:hypothetical protein DBV15_02005 [Temnothorax longispinosus]|uniref:Uncharacterized protein n=1 Tax=Temnothorax longispinosus TaxID=300112 RepID=A0A4V3SAM3_9HYME|nr:hypothetical protein DBV15_02005 [Temnothorax longispinosus]
MHFFNPLIHSQKEAKQLILPEKAMFQVQLSSTALNKMQTIIDVEFNRIFEIAFIPLSEQGERASNF